MLSQEIFIAHSSVDEPRASDLADLLRQHQLPVWYSRTNITGAQQWHDEIGAALRRCDWFVVLLSPDSVISEWVKRELIYALGKPHYKNRIIPVLLTSCNWEDLSWTLAGFQMVDFTQNTDDANRELLRTWGVSYRKGQTA